MKVCFRIVEEFLEEIREDAALVEDGMVRVTRLYRDAQPPPLMHLYMVAGAVIRGKVVELRQYCGQVFAVAPDQYNREVNEKPEAFAGEVIGRVRAESEQLGFEVRSGFFEP